MKEKKLFTFICYVLFSFAFFLKSEIQQPKVTIVTSVYNGDKFIDGFMEDIVRQTMFDQCELIVVNAASPGVREEAVIFEYMKSFPNIVYVKLSQDPGVYGVWNLGVRMARGEYVTNANLDDRLDPQCYALHAVCLDNNPDVDLVYSDYYITHNPNETMQNHSAKRRSNLPRFSRQAMRHCLPNTHPMWRKSFHTKFGYFDESYKCAGDYEMWLRAVEKGARFLKAPGVLGLYYYNPQGLSTDEDRAVIESLQVRKKYSHVYYSEQE